MALDDIPLLSGARPPFGHGAEINSDRFALLARMTREVDPVARLRFLTRDVVIVNSAAANHEVLVAKARSFDKAPLIRAALYPLAGEGLFTSGGELWRRQRQLMAPAFRRTQIDAFAPQMVQCAQRACEAWTDGAVLDVAAETTRVAMSVAGSTLFGMDTFGETDTIGHALTTALEWAGHASSASLALSLQVELRLALQRAPNVPAALRGLRQRLVARLESPILWPTARNRALRGAIALLDARVQHMIEQRRRHPRQQPDLLECLLDARDDDDGSAMSDKQVRDEILTLFVAGHETTATGLAWSLYLLARHPEAYARARAAVDALGGRAPGLGDLERLGFLERVFKEALRLYPPVYLFARISNSEVSIAGHTLPPQTIVVLSPFTVQRRPDLWPDPLRFDPDRFLPEHDAARPRGAFIAFSDGPRVCIGAYFALIEAPLVLATMLQRVDFALTSAAEILPESTATLRPRGGVPLRVTRRPTLATSNATTASA
jgi:cytochrome P450